MNNFIRAYILKVTGGLMPLLFYIIWVSLNALYAPLQHDLIQELSHFVKPDFNNYTIIFFFKKET